MKRQLLNTLALLLCLLNTAQGGDVLKASCRFGNGGRVFVYKADAENFYLLTAGHCCDAVRPPFVQFIHAGLSPRIPCKVKAYHNDTRPIGEIVVDPTEIQGEIISHDIGILIVRKADLRGYPAPVPIPLADDADALDISDKISVAARRDNQPITAPGKVMWVNRYYFRFDFAVAPGWSGSGFCTADGLKLIGILVKGNRETGDGIVLHHRTIRRVLGNAL